MNSLRVVIADDEPAARTVLRMQEWEKHGCTLVGEAEDGQQVLDLLEKNSVDVVLLDVGMPVMNGLELAPLITQHYPAVKIIFLTMYREFDYAVEAMRTGAIDYLIKDVADTEKIFAALDRARTRSEEELEWELVQEKSLREKMANVMRQPLKLDQPVRLLYLTRPEKEGGHCPLYRVAQRLMQLPGYTACWPVREDQWLLVSKCDDTEVVAYLESCWGQDFHITNTITGCSDGGSAIAMGETYLRESFYHPERRMLRDRCYVEEFASPMLEEFGASIRACFYDVSRDATVFNEWVSRCEKCHIAPSALKQALIRLLPVSVAGKAETSALPGALWNARTAAETMALIRSWLLKMRLAGSGKRIEIRQVEDYVCGHLAGNLSMQILSDHVGLSPNYLNHLFREEMHETLKSYVMRIRMEKAADMLKHTDMRIHEVASQVGFPTARYFSDAFSKYYGVTPKEYRRGVIKTHETIRTGT